MTEPSRSNANPPPKWVLLVAGLIIGLAAWFFLRSYTSSGTRECQALYRSARTTADTARVDTTVTPGSRATQEPSSCGAMRSNARWQ